MRKLISSCLAVMIIGILFFFTGCTKNTVGAADATQEIQTESPGGTAIPTQESQTDFEIGNEKIKLAELSLLSDKVSILMPESFSVMSDEMADSKYVVERRPTIIYTNENGTVNVALSYTKNKANEKQIKQLLESIMQSFEKMYPSALWYDSGMVEINGKNAGYMELLTPAADTDIYNLLWFTELDGILLISTFNCTKEQMDDWKPIAKTIMASQQYFSNSNTIEPPTSSSREFIIDDYSIQVTCPDGWWQSESDVADLLCLYQEGNLAMCIYCLPESDFSKTTKQEYFDTINQSLLVNCINVQVLEEMTERQYDNKTIASVLYSGEDEGTLCYYSNLVSMKDSAYLMWVVFIGEPSDFEAGTETFDKILQEIKSIEE